ncbi:MAG: thiamine diphosphokinase [Lachnospiraceae bacterium]
MKKEHVIIVSGGTIDSDFALAFLEKSKEYTLFAVDGGLDFCYRQKLVPQYIVGDFDSADSSQLAAFEELGKSTMIRLNPEKDDSDTQHAMMMALDRQPRQITLLGATGTRFDHTLANLALLLLAQQRGVSAAIIDSHNHMTLRDRDFKLEKSEAFGNFVSFFSYGHNVENLTLTGFKYPLTNHLLQKSDAGLTVSNEIVSRVAEVSFTKGILLVIMSKD